MFLLWLWYMMPWIAAVVMARLCWRDGLCPWLPKPSYILPMAAQTQLIFAHGCPNPRAIFTHGCPKLTNFCPWLPKPNQFLPIGAQARVCFCLR